MWVYQNTGEAKNYAFEFVHSINEIVQNETMCSIWNGQWHTLIVDESTDIAVRSIENGDPVAKHYYKKPSDPKYKVTRTALGDVLGELAQLCLSLQKCNLTVMEGHRFGRAKIEKLHSQYLWGPVEWQCQRDNEGHKSWWGNY